MAQKCCSQKKCFVPTGKKHPRMYPMSKDEVDYERLMR